MYLSDLTPGEDGVLSEIPAELRPFGLQPGNRISLVMRRPGLFVIDAEGARFAICGTLAGQTTLEKTFPEHTG